MPNRLHGLLFLKYLDGLEQDKAAEAMLEGRQYTYILDENYRWSSCAAPKDENGNICCRVCRYK